jgi:hypothetical protein
VILAQPRNQPFFILPNRARSSGRAKIKRNAINNAPVSIALTSP